MKFLVKKTTYFIDPHGTPDEGGVEKFITDSIIYKYTDPDLYYSDSFPTRNFQTVKGNIVNYTEANFKEMLANSAIDEDNMYAEDGYNYRVSGYEVVEITNERAKELQHIIDSYSSI
jgi:hypothetical protein